MKHAIVELYPLIRGSPLKALHLLVKEMPSELQVINFLPAIGPSSITLGM